MNRRERKKERKKKARQERLRQQKHSRQSLRRSKNQAEGENLDLDHPEPPSAALSPLPTERLLEDFRQALGEHGVPTVEELEQLLEESTHGPGSHASPSAAGPGDPESQGQELDNFFKGEPAQKWLDELLAGTDAMPILHALEPVEYVPGHLLLKASVCCEMLVAAELVAAGRGRPSRHLPSRVAAWLVEQDMLFSPGVVALAAAAVRRVGEFSELRQLWDTVRLGQEWLRGVEALCSRLRE
jgi:hypothetical protein